MSRLQQLNPKIYLSGAIVLGFFEVIDGIFTFRGYASGITQAFSLLELSWFLVTIVFFFSFKKQQITLLVPGLYIGYTLYGFIVGSYLLSIKLPTEVLVVPVWFIISAALFGLIYCIISIRTYWLWYLKKQFT